MVFVAVMAVILRLLQFPMAPLLLGFILGGMLEDNLRRALTISGGDWGYFTDRPLTLTLAALVVLVLLSPLLQWLRSRRENP